MSANVNLQPERLPSAAGTLSAAVVVADTPKRKPKPKTPKPVREPKPLFSDETALYFLRLLKGKNYRGGDLPKEIVLSPAASPSTANRSAKRDALQEELAFAVRESLLPWLWSFFVHSVILIILALLFLPKIENRPFEILGGIGDDLVEFQQDWDLGPGNKNDDPLIITPQDLPPVEDPAAVPPKMETVATGDTAASDTDSNVPPGLSFGNRIGSHTNSFGGGGGTGRTDEAVVAGLRWLMKVQSADGGWRLGTARNPVPKERENRNAATAMALLCFQGYGITHTPHPQLREFAKSVQLGWQFLRRQQHTDGCFFRDEGLVKTAFYEHRFYTHGLCTIALGELLAMTGDETLREPLEKAVQYCVKHQSVESGGWRYRPDRFSTESDVSVTGWILMALKTAQAAGAEVPNDVFIKIDKFLDAMGQHGGTQYIYREEEPERRLSMTAEALLCRELLGWKHTDGRLKQGIEFLTLPENLPAFDKHYKRDVYTWYYASQALHHYGGEAWNVWNKAMRELLPEYQEKSGTNAGSWNPDEPVKDTWGTYYGRLYTTALSILILETYYRHGRIYR
ncbi:MAG: terpene cyclase/mutase family protein [Planctomycetaceae bacterium]|nr:terpene cyclase/mutase family protein [Planctomycetaceae bacterium]